MLISGGQKYLIKVQIIWGKVLIELEINVINLFNLICK